MIAGETPKHRKRIYPMIPRVLLCVAVCLSSVTGQTPRTPDLRAQHAAMQKLTFLVGQWSGEAQVFPAGKASLTLDWSEDAQYKLDGLLLEIEAKGRNKTDNKIIRQALGFVSYDDFTGTYRMRTFNDGRYLETDLKLLDGENGFTWGFEIGDIKTSSVLRINDKGEWTEVHHITVGSQPTRKLMEVRVSRRK
jgi:hypothetical protein